VKRSSCHAAVASTGERRAGDAPVVVLLRPHLSRAHVGLGCHHATMLLAETVPKKLPCPSCAAGRPADLEATEAATADAVGPSERGSAPRTGFGSRLDPKKAPAPRNSCRDPASWPRIYK
jgi:hypothetical protein